MRNKPVLMIIAGTLLFCALLFTATTSPHTFAASRHAAVAIRPVVYPYACPQTIMLGSTGYTVYTLQNQLNANGYYVPVTGYFDIATQIAVRNFQISMGLPPTGIVDWATWHYLGAC